MLRNASVAGTAVPVGTGVGGGWSVAVGIGVTVLHPARTNSNNIANKFLFMDPPLNDKGTVYMDHAL